uniref:Uncharacterized protein LOC123616688 n=1 Tax=Camelus bactrianus TaxID=9837 RepID=A0A9W3HIH7_CAMBA|nr:uncharacterized protein LOC123616688 [Camelus bactrianus]
MGHTVPPDLLLGTQETARVRKGWQRARECRRQEGTRAPGTSHLLTKPTPPPDFGEEMLFPTVLQNTDPYRPPNIRARQSSPPPQRRTLTVRDAPSHSSSLLPGGGTPHPPRPQDCFLASDEETAHNAGNTCARTAGPLEDHAIHVTHARQKSHLGSHRLSLAEPARAGRASSEARELLPLRSPLAPRARVANLPAESQRRVWGPESCTEATSPATTHSHDWSQGMNRSHPALPGRGA